MFHLLCIALFGIWIAFILLVLSCSWPFYCHTAAMPLVKVGESCPPLPEEKKIKTHSTGCNITPLSVFFKKRWKWYGIALGISKVAYVTSFLYWKWCDSTASTTALHTPTHPVPFSCQATIAWQPQFFIPWSLPVASIQLPQNCLKKPNKQEIKKKKEHHTRPLWLCISASLLADDWEKCICLMTHGWLNLLNWTSLRRLCFLLETDSCQNNMLIIIGVIILHSIVRHSLILLTRCK